MLESNYNTWVDKSMDRTCTGSGSGQKTWPELDDPLILLYNYYK